MNRFTRFTDGKAGLTVERHGGTVRFMEQPAEGSHPAFIGSCNWHSWTDKVCAIAAASVPNNKLSPRHQRLLVAMLRDAGMEWLMVERAHGVVPLSKPCTYPPFAGWWECDLKEAESRANARYPHDAVKKV